MKRAVIIIGVKQAGDLPELTGAWRGARLMEKWAQDQRIDSIHVLTDEQRPVDASSIKTLIRNIVDSATFSQLVIYFAGHGVNKDRHEYWLLSDALNDADAAVNVAGSVALASTCGIPQIILISDACRTAAEGIRAHSIGGSLVFPIRDANESPVDQFFACKLGQPSYEVKDPLVSSSEYTALYTDELVPALLGRRPEAIDWNTQGAERVGFIRLRPLRDYMSSAVAARLEALQLQSKVIQVPTAQIASDPPAWLSRVPESRGQTGTLGMTPAYLRRPRDPIVTAGTIATSLLESALKLDSLEFRKELEASRISSVAGASGLVSSVELVSLPYGRLHHETQCGFKIRGSRIVSMHARDVTPEFAPDDSPSGDDIRVHSVKSRGASVLLVLETGAGIVLPAIPGFLGTITVEEDEVVDVAYEPSSNTPRWEGYTGSARSIRALRAVASSLMTRGMFRPDGDMCLALSAHMLYPNGIDPSLAIYTAYGYHELQRLEPIREMVRHMRSYLGAPIFDIALLSRALTEQAITRDSNLISSVPLLSQGWTLLAAYRVSLPGKLNLLKDMLLPSVWTMIDKCGVDLVKDAINSGEIR